MNTMDDDAIDSLSNGLGSSLLDMLGLGQGQPGLARTMMDGPPSGAGHFVSGDPDGNVPSPMPVNPRITPENIERFGRVLQSECGGICKPAEIQGVGSTILNRMDRQKTDSVLDVTPKNAYALGQDPKGPMLDVARQMLSGGLPRNTDATHFYSPRSMPKPGIPWTGPSQDTAGGMELVHGQGTSKVVHDLRKAGSEIQQPFDVPIAPELKDTPQLEMWNYRPSWAAQYPQADVPGVRDWYFKFYTQPSKGRH